MSWLNLQSLSGCLLLGLGAWLVGGCRRPAPWRTILGSATLLLVLGCIVFLLPPTRTLLLWLNNAVIAVLSKGNAGAEFLFGPLALNPGQSTVAGEPSIGFIFAAQVLPAVIFFAALMALGYHLRLIQPLVKVFARLFRQTLRLSGAESLLGAANIFFGVEAVTSIRPYLAGMTRSELLTALTCGMSTVASTTLAIYVLFLQRSFPQIAGHLISASVLSIPAAALISKLILPERETPQTLGQVPEITQAEKHQSTMGALMAGAWEGLKLAAGIAALLIAVLGVVALINLLLGWLSSPLAGSIGGILSLERLLGWLFMPLAWLLGIAPTDLTEAGRLLGQRMVLTEIPSYQQLGQLAAAQALDARSIVVLSYALCGFTHIASVGIFVGGFAALAPERREDLAALGLRALVGATLATLLTGALAGLFYHGQQGLLGL